MFGIGFPELLMILVVALLVIGPKKLPDLAKTLGKGLAEFRKATEDLKDTVYQQEPANEVKAEQTAKQRQIAKLPLTSGNDETVNVKEKPDDQGSEKASE
ncbi:MAG TPA: twin-arginine translocase subunit TatB [Proteobacteria bacterium]|nr:MAG: twin-arginine translocase subunit TatB [Deltaproteobacteria bacterium]HDJ27848.1 twin-arginine translocase subunit TatB [Pseudomonadota bacterium]